jgi:tetratricopeptide (TPR) repeat protein
VAERARAVRPRTVFSEADLDAVGRIARALDGIPLALELAAARSATLSATEISSRLEHRFDLLTSGSRTAEERQRTLRATVDWSYALLTDEEQRVFNRLAVFQGGCTLEAAEAVVGDDDAPAGAVLDVVARLVQRSMLLAETGARTRYRLLETLRQYAVDQLREAGEARTVAARHATYFHGLVLTLGTTLRGHGQRGALSALRQEQPNIRAALSWLSGPNGDIDAAFEMAGALGLFWHLGRHLEGRDVLTELLRRGGASDAARAHALQAVSLVERPRACLVHPSPLCAETAQASLDIFQAQGDTSNAALSKVLLAVEGVTGQQRERQQALLGDAEHEFGQGGDEWGLGVIGFVRMETALKTGDLDAAIAVGHAAAARFRQLDDPWGLSAVLYHLGWGLRQFGHFEAGARTLAQAIDVAQQAGLYNTAQWAFADLALVELNLGNATSARELFDRASAASVHVGDGAGEVLADYGHGLLALEVGAIEEAARRFECAADGFILLKTPVWQGWALLGSARCAEIRGEHPTAAALYAQARELGSTAGEPGLVASSLEGLSRTAAARGTGLSDALAAEAVAVRRQFGRPRPPHQDSWFPTAADHT